METTRICPNCHKPLAADAPLGLCPECLVQAGFPSGTGSGTGPAPVAAPALEEVARLFPQLEILELIGRGGMGAVYKARQKQLDRVVALKILPPGIGHQPTFAERFAREARALAQLNHPGIVTLYEFGQADGLFYFLMEYVDGLNLRQLLANGRVSAREALAIVPQICDALQYAHDQGIVHRDIKPENILLDRRGRVKVADFGLAKLVEVGNEPAPAGAPAAGSPSLTEAGRILGTPQYMSPEQIQAPGEVDHRADIYALGVVFYQMLTGELPGKKIEPPSHKVRIDVRLDEVVLRALEKQPGLRYQQASVLKTQIETIVADPQPAAPVNNPGMKRYMSSEWHFALDIPRNWHAFPPVSTNSPAEVIRFALNEDGTHMLIIFRSPHDPKKSLEQYADEVQKELAGHNFGNFVTGRTTIGSRAALTLDFDRAKDGGTWSCREYLVAEGTLRYTLGFGTTNKAGMFALFDRVAKSFDFGDGSVPQTKIETIVPPPESSRGEGPPSKTSGMGNLTSEIETRISRAAVVGVCWAPLVLLALITPMFVRLPPSSAGEVPGLILAGIIMLVGIAAPFGTTILGWIAVNQIRHSRGRLRGMGLAVFDGLAFPLLVADGFFISLVTRTVNLWVSTPAGVNTDPRGQVAVIRMAFQLTALLVVIWSNRAIVRAIWQRLKPPGNDGSSSVKPGSHSRVAGVVILLLLIVAIVEGVLSQMHAGSGEKMEVHYRVFEVESALAERLIPETQRHIGATGNWQMAGISPETLDALLEGRVMNKHVMMDRHCEIPNQGSSKTYVSSQKPGAEQPMQQVVIGWPVVTDGFGSSLSNGVANDVARVSGTGYFGVRRKDGQLQLKTDYTLSYTIGNRPGVDVNIAYEGTAAKSGATAFLIPFDRKDDATGYYIFTIEVQDANAARDVQQLENGISATPRESPRPFVGYFPRGSVELTAVGGMPWTNLECWLPDGSPSSEPFPEGGVKEQGDASEKWADLKKLAFHVVAGFPDTVSEPAFRCKESGFYGFEGVWVPRLGSYTPRVGPTNAEELYEVFLNCPSNALTADFSVGVATGPWIDALVEAKGDETTASFTNRGTTSLTGNRVFTMSGSEFVNADGSGTVSVEYSGTNGDGVMRVVYVTSNGITGVIPAGPRSTQLSSSAKLTFPAKQWAQVKSFCLQYRPYEWVEFQNVSLLPGHRTQAKVISAGAGPPP